MLKITRERKKYRVKSPYDEAEKRSIQERQAEKLKRKKEEQRQKNKEQGESNNLENKILKICELVANGEKTIQKYDEVNTKMEKIKEKSFRRRTRKKLANTIKKNKLKQKLIKKDLLWKTEKVLPKLEEQKKKNSKRKNKENHKNHPDINSKKDSSKNSQPEIRVCQNKLEEQKKKQLQEDKHITENENIQKQHIIRNKKNSKKQDVINSYNQMINTEEFAKNPLQFIKQNIKK